MLDIVPTSSPTKYVDVPAAIVKGAQTPIGGGRLGETDHGKVNVRPTSSRAPTTVTLSAPGSAYFQPWSITRTYGR